ncbi:MAG: IS66 family transposase [Nitrococcus sp.]|nr:IS66 family transposase [Nitrococcus sp.]
MSVGKFDITATLARAEQALKKEASLTPSTRVLLETLMAIIRLLVAKQALNSTNSSIPPSQDPNRARGSKKKAGQRKPGGQPGHPGATLTPLPADQIETLSIDQRTLPVDGYHADGFEARQVIDIHISRHVTEYRAEVLVNAKGQRFVAQFPPGVTQPVQYANSVKAQAVYLSQQQLIPYERCREHFADVYGIPLSVGSLVNFNREAFYLLERFEIILKQQLCRASLLHADETGINVGGKLMWLHCLSNLQWTLFFPHPRRGEQAQRALDVLAHFHGTLCHDHWKSYFCFAYIHALCNAHHLRELERAWQQDQQRWAKKMHTLLLEMNAATHDTGGCLDEPSAEAFTKRYRSILTKGDEECPAVAPKPGTRRRPAQSKPRNLLERLRDFEEETLRFMTDPDVPFTNNQGENDERMTKVQQKISGCFRSFRGAQYFCRIRGYLSTCRKHGVSATEALGLLFSGKLPDFVPPLG